MHIPLKIIGSSKLSGGPWNILKPLENNKILLLKENTIGQYPRSYRYGKFSEVSAILPACLFLKLSQNSKLVVGLLESGHIMVWDTVGKVVKLVSGQPEFNTEKLFEDDNDDILNVCEETMNIIVVTRRHLSTWSPSYSRQEMFSTEEKTSKGVWRRAAHGDHTTMAVDSRYVKRRYAWVTAMLGRKQGNRDDDERGLEVTIAQHDPTGEIAYRREVTLPVIACTGTSHPICRLDHEAVLLCVSHPQRVSLVSAETGHIVSSVQVGGDICGITWHLGSSIFVITGSSRYVSAFSRTLQRFYLRLGDDLTFMEQLNTDLILKSDFEEGSHISVFSYKNDLIISNG